MPGSTLKSSPWWRRLRPIRLLMWADIVLPGEFMREFHVEFLLLEYHRVEIDNYRVPPLVARSLRWGLLYFSTN